GHTVGRRRACSRGRSGVSPEGPRLGTPCDGPAAHPASVGTEESVAFVSGRWGRRKGGLDELVELSWSRLGDRAWWLPTRRSDPPSISRRSGGRPGPRRVWCSRVVQGSEAAGSDNSNTNRLYKRFGV